MLPEDGWELIRRDFGYTDQNTVKPEAPQHTYFILYNKYTGVLRVLLKTCRNADYNSIKTRLSFDATTSFQTALLNFVSEAKALNVVHEKNPSVQSVSVFVNDNTKWFYADFPMAYDPCSCMYKSKLNIISQLIENSTITLEGSITGTITSITGGKGSVKNDGSYSFKDFVNDADKFKKVQASFDNFITQTKNVAATIPKSTDVVAAIDNFSNEPKSSQLLKTGLAAVPWLQSAVGFFDFFSAGGKSSPQQVQLMPMSVDLSAKLSGTINTTNQYHNIIFTNPGSLDAKNDPDIYPFYNEVLGVFNLLNTPVFTKKVYYYFFDEPDYTVSQIPTYQLKEPIKWVLNPASGLELQDAQVAYVAESYSNVASNPPAALPVDYLTSFNPKPTQGFDYLEVKNASTGYWQYRTAYVNINCLGNDHAFKWDMERPYSTYDWPPVRQFYLKFILNFKRKDNPSAQNVLLVLKYPISEETTNVNVPASATPFNPASCSGGRIVQATASDVNSFCSSSA